MHNSIYKLIKNLTASLLGKKVYYSFCYITYLLIPDSLFQKILYRLRMGKSLNLKEPKDFTEKINWLKLNYRKSLLTKLADKYEVRKYVANKVGEEVLIPILGVYDSFDEIDFDTLPNKFILKANHGSGWNVVCEDKKIFNIVMVRKLFNLWLKTNYYHINRTWEYRDIKPKIVCEKFISSKNKLGLDDYKIHCFAGVPKYIQYLSDRLEGKTKGTFYDLNWKVQEFFFTNPKHRKNNPKPKSLKKMLLIAKKLSEDLPYARVDLYNNDGESYFGEITLHPVNGMDRFIPEKYDRVWGDLLYMNKES